MAVRGSPPAEVLPERRSIVVQGIVQGVGFRPFVARLAERWELTGWVANSTRGVEIEIQGPRAALDGFGAELRTSPPSMAQILEARIDEVPRVAGEEGFRIRASRTDPVAAAIIPPDIATCASCRAELLDPADRRHRYPFLNCTDCGPRYSIIRSVPYDRGHTGMSGFTMCPDCEREYGDAANRRFHAQPNACPACGPRLILLGPDGARRDGEPLGEAIEGLRTGGIVALMGLGGFHLACDGEREDAVRTLRERKRRPAKPFAVMVPDLATARDVAVVDSAAEALLQGPRAPILLLPRRPAGPIAPSVAPGQDRLGIFLPYTPLHHLLFTQGGFRSLVMTSGNRSDEPILASVAEALAKLAGVPDLYLVHDRPIVHRVDDSVVKSMGPAGPTILRRARGYAPAPLPLPNPEGRVVLAVGAELANSFAVTRGAHAYLGPHVGDLKNLEVEEAFRAGIDHLLDLLRVRPDAVACDMHPAYVSSRYAAEWAEQGIPVVRVQHHEAHAAACMAEHGHWDDAVVLAADGFGLGEDGSLRGCELLVGRPGRFRRAGHLVPVPQPGGDRAAREPWRMAASYLRRIHGPAWLERPLPVLDTVPRADREVLEALMARGTRAPATSSCGRLFDAAAAILGFQGPMLYSAQAPMELEALAATCPHPVEAYDEWEAPGKTDGLLLLDPLPILRRLEEDALADRDRREAALGFHRGLSGLFAAAICDAAQSSGLERVFLTGGCFQNAILLQGLTELLFKYDLTVSSHRDVPPNDGGIAFGQAAWVAGHFSKEG